MSNVDFREIADGVATGSESKCSTPNANKLIRALLKADPMEVSDSICPPSGPTMPATPPFAEKRRSRCSTGPPAVTARPPVS